MLEYDIKVLTQDDYSIAEDIQEEMIKNNWLPFNWTNPNNSELNYFITPLFTTYPSEADDCDSFLIICNGLKFQFRYVTEVAHFLNSSAHRNN